MFNNIIYFIIVLLIFSLNYPDSSPENSLFYFLIILWLTWVIFAGVCYLGFRDIGRLFNNDIRHKRSDGSVTGQYNKLIARLSAVAIFLFALDVYFLNLKHWLQMIPGLERLSVLQGLLALSLFLFYLSTIWYFAYPAYKAIFRANITRKSYILSNFRINLPVLFPWFVLSLAYDLMLLTHWGGPDGFLDNIEGQIVFFSCFLILLMVFMPAFIQHWWGCNPIRSSEKGRKLEEFLREKGFKYRRLLNWPIFEGKMMTAGIMGVIPRYRYLLITDSLLEYLSVEELKAVLAHEMGHAKYRHLLLYIVFFVGFMVLSTGLFDLFFYLFYGHPLFMNMLSHGDPQAVSLFYMIMSAPMLICLFVYFRYVMGFFMRNFERQADLYSAETMGSPEPAINSLEKIAELGGKSRDLPSWHHFSIRERVDTLWRTLREPGLVRRHNRFVAVSFLVFLICLGGLGYFLNFSTTKRNLTYELVGKELNQRLLKEPENIELYQGLAMVYQHLGRNEKAIETYKRILDLDASHAVSLNNLAWLLVTVPEERLRDPGRALDLAKKAVAIEQSPVFLDTLAEAYYVNGLVREAVKTMREAIAVATENRGYYEKQLEKFLDSTKR
jgi:Zn-dependent protease with chaperone function